MGMRKVWKARFTQFRAGERHTYSGNTLVGYVHTVAVGVVVKEPGHAQLGRELVIHLRPEQALLYADQIRLLAEKAHEENRRDGVR